MSAGSNIATEHAAHARVAAAWQRSYARGADDALGWPAACRGALPAGASGRAAADALAAWMRWHDAAAGALFTDAEWPCYAALERARVETLAARDLPGVARNLAPDAALQPGQDGLSGLYVMARAMLSGGAMPGALALAPPPARRSLWSRLVASARRTPAAPAPDVDAVRRALEAAALDIGDGVAYAHALRALIAALAPCFVTDAAARDAAQSPRAAGAAEEHADAAASIAHQAGTEAPQHDALFERSYADYKIYSRAADQEARAAHWLQAGDAARLAQLDAVDRRQA
ncbi:MAG: hypothetical protein JNJ60_02325, partial [Rhodocyclaceae bacterium]|nr:hypothetical protein [Rhodocyclaceae bacterium]